MAIVSNLREGGTETLEALGHNETNARSVLSAHDLGCCYLCHVPYNQTLEHCVCPHWLVMSWPSLRRIEQVLHTYDLEAVVRYLLTYLTAGARDGARNQPFHVYTDAQARHLVIKTKRRQWQFSLHDDPGSAAQPTLDGARLHFQMETRSPKDFSCWLVPGESDVLFIHRLFDHVDMPQALWASVDASLHHPQ